MDGVYAYGAEMLPITLQSQQVSVCANVRLVIPGSAFVTFRRYGFEDTVLLAKIM